MKRKPCVWIVEIDDHGKWRRWLASAYLSRSFAIQWMRCEKEYLPGDRFRVAKYVREK